MLKKILLLFVLVFSLPSFASETTRLTKLTRKWQNKLGMKEWKIETRPAPYSLFLDIIGYPATGMSSFSPNKTGVIYVMLEDDYTPKIKKKMGIKNVRNDQQNTIVHELLHNIWRHSLSEEDGVSVISNGFVPPK